MGKRKSDQLSDAPEPYQAANWAWTLHKWTPAERQHLESLHGSGAVRCIAFQEEICPTTGSPHLQGCTVFLTKKTRKACQLVLLPGRAEQLSCKPCYASAGANKEYCTKEGGENPYQAGEWPASQAEKGESSKERTQAIMALAKAGQFSQLEDEYPEAWFYQQRAIMAARGHSIRNDKSLDGVLENYWIYGKPGQGKGMYVDLLSPVHYTKSANSKWWCGYDGQEDVLLDDAGQGIVPLLDLLKNWSDRRPFNAEVKGGNWLIRPRRVFITSNHPPSRFITDPEDLDAIRRRFQIVHMVDNTPHWFARTNVAKPVIQPPVMLADEWVP